jgi:hypothetical protein
MISIGLAVRAGWYLESVVKVANFAKTVQELVDSCLVIFHKWIERCHVRFFRIRRFVCQVLEHFCDLQSRSTEPRSPIVHTYQSQRPSRVLGRNSVDQHVRLRRDHRWIDESKEEESSDKRANGYVGRLGIFSLPSLLEKKGH